MHPGEVTSILMTFDLPATPFTVPPSPRTGGNEYVYHCHILEHEEHDMMRPMIVLGAGQVTNLQVQPPSAILAGKSGGTVQYVIGGGRAPYTVTSSNAAFVPVLVNNVFSVTVKNNTAPTVVTFTVKDSSGPQQQVAVTLTIA